MTAQGQSTAGGPSGGGAGGPSGGGSAAARALAWAAIAAQVAFTVGWIVGGALEPGYSHVEEGVSALGAGDASHPAIANAAILVLGLGIAALGPALLPVLPRRRSARAAAALFVGAGAAIAAAALLPLDCGPSDERCRDLWEAGRLSWQHDAHLWASLAASALLVLTPFALARALWPAPVGAAALSAGTSGIAIWGATWVLFAVGDDHGDADGLIQRAGFLVVHAWVLIVAIGVLWSTRRERGPGPLVPVRPRDFFTRTWTGDGELLIRPLFLGRRLARRFEARRTATWASDRVWRFDDDADYGDGRVQRRTTWCEFVSDDHVRLTAGDLPDGADVWFEEAGFRIAPFRMLFPIGPVPALVRCHDVSHVEPDGTLVSSTDVRSIVLGLPLARVTFRVRPADAAD
ncbi:MAG TPA: DUF998 domain-containing protein [Thermoleophilaceae bacterium]|jgi:hypothetical protein